MKLFGIGLPRTGTTSLAVAAMELGFKTCHTCFIDTSFMFADAFFDTPIYADYPMLDRRFPNSKFILTHRDPRQWCHSFLRTLEPMLLFARNRFHINNLTHRCYIQIFGSENNVTEQFMISRYEKHFNEAKEYFRGRESDFLMLNICESNNAWETLCEFLGHPPLEGEFPALNGLGVTDWHSIEHKNKYVEESPFRV